MGVDAWGFDKGRQALAKRLRTRRNILSLVRASAFFSFLVILVSGGSAALDAWLSSGLRPGWIQTAAFLVVVFAIGSAIGFPFAYLSAYRWEVESGLSRRTFGSWLRDQAKASALGLAATVLAGEVILWLLDHVPSWWWLAAWSLGVVAGFALAMLAPLFLVPLFFRSRPVADPAVRSRLEALARSAGLPVLGAFELGASAKTRRSNAGVMGFGRMRRIVVTDTLLQEYSADEIDAVLAHELGHQKFRDPWTGFAWSAGFSLFLSWAVGTLFAATHEAFGVMDLARPASLPIVALYASLGSALGGPFDLWRSRKRERRADHFALELTRNPKAFESAIVKLHDKNLGVAAPRAWEVWLHYGHPTGRERVESARSVRFG